MSFRKIPNTFRINFGNVSETAKENNEIYDTSVLNKINLSGGIFPKVEK